MDKLLILLLVTSISHTASASMFYDCLSTEKLRKDKQFAQAKEMLMDDLRDCYRFPLEEKYEACRYHAQLKLEKEQDRILKDFRIRQRACFRNEV